MSDFVIMAIFFAALVFVAALLQDTSPPQDPYGFA